MTISTKALAAAHNALNNPFDGMPGSFARLLSLGRTYEGEGVGTNTESNPPRSRARTRSDDDDGDEGDDDPVWNDRGTKFRQPTAYEIRLRNENAKARKKAAAQKADDDAEIARLTGELDKVTKAQQQAIDAAVAEATKGHEDALKAAQKEGNDKLIRLNLKAALKAADCQNIDDALKLIDGSAIQITEAGDVDGIEPLIEGLKKDKAYLFTAPTATTSSTATTPPAKKDGDPKSALEMTDEEYAASRAAFTGTSSRTRRR